jgi:hypothetical protein
MLLHCAEPDQTRQVNGAHGFLTLSLGAAVAGTVGTCPCRITTPPGGTPHLLVLLFQLLPVALPPGVQLAQGAGVAGPQPRLPQGGPAPHLQ